MFITRFTKDSPRFKDELEIMKYICKDFWTAVYKKQIDNLRTNHQVNVFESSIYSIFLAWSNKSEVENTDPNSMKNPHGLPHGLLYYWGKKYIQLKRNMLACTIIFCYHFSANPNSVPFSDPFLPSK